MQEETKNHSGLRSTTETPARRRPEIRWPRADLTSAELRRIVLEMIG